MIKSKMLLSGAAAMSLVSLSACVTDPNTGERTFSRTAAGGALGGTLGYLLGDLIGGSTAARIIGAGIGGTAGAVIGDQFDDQIRELDEATAGTGVDVEEIGDQDAILVRMPDITFATGSAAIGGNFQSILNDVASSLQRYPNSLIDVYGFTDTTGSPSTNQALSNRRAQAVADYLASRGVSRARMATQGFGEQTEYLRVQTADGVNEPLNRRVEIKITPISQDDVRAAQN
ncbi:OmpA family protein [Qipengyuania sp. JC766]|uniref:OmpA family protein n=1 Tax=Qipengyuania sp. JC766 TaxID=3232139 RepID=UPI0034584163